MLYFLSNLGGLDLLLMLGPNDNTLLEQNQIVRVGIAVSVIEYTRLGPFRVFLSDASSPGISASIMDREQFFCVHLC